MASGLRKRSYTRAEVTDVIYEDSEGDQFEDVSSENDNDSNVSLYAK